MAGNVLYDPGREGFLDGSIDWDTDDIRVILLKTGYTFSAAHKFVSELTPASYEQTRLGSGMGSKTVTNGIADAADAVFTSLSGADVYYIVIYKYNAADASARLIAYIDTATGLPFTPNGGDVTIQWANSGNYIFKL